MLSIKFCFVYRVALHFFENLVPPLQGKVDDVDTRRYYQIIMSDEYNSKFLVMNKSERLAKNSIRH